MNKQATRTIIAFAVLLTLQTGCNPAQPKTEDVKPPLVTIRDTLKLFLMAQKMEVGAYQLVKKGSYDSAINQYNKCFAFLNKALDDNNGKGTGLYASVFMQAHEGLVSVYDYLNKPDSALTHTLACLKWDRLTNDSRGQITTDVKIAERLSRMAENTTNDSASLFRRAVQYALAGARVIDSLKTNDMDDLRYNAFHATAKIYATAGNKKQAAVYDKKYRNVYFKIYQKQPEGN